MEEERDRFLPVSAGKFHLSLQQREETPLPAPFDFKKILFSKAFLVVPGPQYNRISYQMRREHPGKNLFFYEIVLSEHLGWQHLRDTVYPNFKRFIRAKSNHPNTSEGIVISLFHEEYFYMIKGADFLLAYREIEGIDPISPVDA